MSIAGAALHSLPLFLELGTMEPETEPPPRNKAVLVSWSGGKDSCMALREIQRSPDLRVEALLTTITRDYDRISMHGVRRILLERQAISLRVPLHQILISKGASNVEYETKIGSRFIASAGSTRLHLAICFSKRSGPIVSSCSPGTGCSECIPSGNAIPSP